jgi:hypothetical protein
MGSGIYAIAHIGHLRLYVCDTTNLHRTWSQILAQLDSGTHPNTVLQEVWNTEGGKRYFTFHTKKDLVNDQEIIEIEKLVERITD